MHERADKVHSDRTDVRVRKGLVRKAQQQRRFADARVANQHELEQSIAEMMRVSRRARNVLVLLGRGHFVAVKCGRRQNCIMLDGRKKRKERRL